MNAKFGYNYQVSQADTIGFSYMYSRIRYSNFPQSIDSHVAQVSYGRRVTGRRSISRSVKPVDTTDVNERLASMQQEILSRTRLEPIIRQYGLYASEINNISMEDLVEHLQKAIEVTPVQPMAETRTSNLPGFFVNVTLDNARTAQQICTAVTSMFIEENLKLRQEHSEDTTQFLSQQLTDAKANLDAQDAVGGVQKPVSRRASGQ